MGRGAISPSDEKNTMWKLFMDWDPIICWSWDTDEKSSFIGEEAGQSFCLIHSLTNIWLNPQSIRNYTHNSPKPHRIKFDSD